VPVLIPVPAMALEPMELLVHFQACCVMLDSGDVTSGSESVSTSISSLRSVLSPNRDDGEYL
jgi:hypothetical protein